MAWKLLWTVIDQMMGGSKTTPQSLAWEMVPPVKVFVGNQGRRSWAAFAVKIEIMGCKKELRWRGRFERHQHVEDLKSGCGWAETPFLLAGIERGGFGPNLAEKIVLRDWEEHICDSATKTNKTRDHLPSLQSEAEPHETVKKWCEVRILIKEMKWWEPRGT